MAHGGFRLGRPIRAHRLYSIGRGASRTLLRRGPGYAGVPISKNGHYVAAACLLAVPDLSLAVAEARGERQGVKDTPIGSPFRGGESESKPVQSFLSAIGVLCRGKVFLGNVFQ